MPKSPKSIPLYLLELRKRVNQHSNKTLNQIGVFSSLKLAHKWILDNPDYAKDYGAPSGVYAACTCDLNKGDYTFFCGFL
jgi:hypothetical protein